jgi:hypothetical protein
LQVQINAAGPTRLPRLDLDQHYGSLTMARVMEFQFHSKFATKDTDGIDGPITQDKLDKTKSSSPKPAGRVILVDLINSRLRAFKDGKRDLDFKPIAGGSTSDPSTRGVFKVFKRLRHHTSSKFPIPPGNMDFALFYHGAEALHQGPPTVPSHGCIHVAPSQAEQLFKWAGSFDVMVVVLKRTR